MQWMTTRKFADESGLHIKTVQRWAREGKLESRRIGARVFVKMKDERSQEAVG